MIKSVSVSLECKCNPKGGAHPGAGEERHRFPLHPGKWSQTQFPIALLRLNPKTMKSVSVSVSVVNTEINQQCAN